MRKTGLAIICFACFIFSAAMPAWAGLFGNNGEKKTQEALGTIIDAGARTARDVRSTGDKVDQATRELGNLSQTIGKLESALLAAKSDNPQKPVKIIHFVGQDDPNSSPRSNTASRNDFMLIMIAALLLAGYFIYRQQKNPAAKPSRDPADIPASSSEEKRYKCSLCGVEVKPENWSRHLKKSATLHGQLHEKAERENRAAITPELIPEA